MVVTTGTSVSLVNPPTSGAVSAYVTPVLQAQDGSFIGTVAAEDGYSMVAFDATGNVRWSLPGVYQPQIATADGGLIAKVEDGTAVTFDQSGNATGQMASLPIQSWLGNAYQYGSTDQIRAKPFFVATGFWSFWGANHSGSSTAIHQQWFPPLSSCTDNGGNCQGPLGPRDLLWNARNDLVSQLNNDKTCSDAAKKNVFSKVTYGGLWGFFESPIAGSEFVTYLQHTQLFYNGAISTLDAKYAKCGEVLRINCTGYNPPQMVKQSFQSSSGTSTTAQTVTPSTPLKIFWQPVYTGPVPSDPNNPKFTGFGVGVDPSGYGVNIYNESNLFHEALHGMTGHYDDELQRYLGIPVQEDSTNISYFIRLCAGICRTTELMGILGDWDLR